MGCMGCMELYLGHSEIYMLMIKSCLSEEN